MKKSSPFLFGYLLLVMVFILPACKEKKSGDETTAEAVRTTTEVIDKNISATLKDSVVTLRGEVMDEATKAAAIKAVKHIEGVKSIQTYLTIKKSPDAQNKREADQKLKAAIDSILKEQNGVSIEVSVADGEVTLRGEVSAEQKATILDHVGQVQPKKVVDELTVK